MSHSPTTQELQLTPPAEKIARSPFASFFGNSHIANSIVLLIVVFCLYLKVTSHEFLINWDDVDYILANRDIQGFSFHNLKQIFSKYYAGNYAPIHLFSYMLDYSIWGLNPAAFKITNVTLHAGCTLLFYHLLVRLGLTAPQAFLASLLFSVHPVQVESVAWVSQRKNPLSLLFFLASWYSWTLWKSRQQQNKMWYLNSLILFVFALLAKSIAVILPVFLLMQELTLHRETFTWRMVASKLPYVMLSGVFIAITLASQKAEGGGVVAYHGGSLAITMMNMLPVFVRYLNLILFPIGLTIVYNAPIMLVPDKTIFLGAVVFALFIAGWVRLRKPHPAHFFWLSLFVIALIPVANIIPLTTMMNDRYLYYPMLGFAPFAILSLDGAMDRLKVHFFPVPAVIAAITIMLFSTACWRQIDVWKNSLSLWADAISKADAGTWYESESNTNFLVEGYTESLVVRATTLRKEGARAEARRYCLLALSYEPGNFNALGLLASLYLDDNKPMQARPYLIKLVALYGKSDIAHAALGLSYRMNNEIENAEEQFRVALGINHRNEKAIAGLQEIAEIRSGLRPVGPYK